MRGSIGEYGRVLADRRFRFYWLSQAAGDAGYAVYAISVIWLGYRLSGSALVVGALLGVEFAVYAGSFIAGAVVDRIRHLRRVLLVGYPLQAAGAIALGVLLTEGRLTVPILLVLVALISFVWDFTWTANNTIPPQIVPEDQLLRANSLVSAVSGGNQIAGYAVGGVLLLLVGPATRQFLYGALNGLAALLAIPVVVDHLPSEEVGLLERLASGFRFLGSGKAAPLRALAVFGALQGAVSLAPPLLITVLSAHDYSAPAATYGVLFTCYAVGGVGGSLLLGGVNPRAHLASVLLGATALEGGSSSPRSPPSRTSSRARSPGPCVGVCDIALWTVLLAYVQARAPPSMLARTITNSYLFRGTTRAGGVVILGVLGALLGADLAGPRRRGRLPRHRRPRRAPAGAAPPRLLSGRRPTGGSRRAGPPPPGPKWRLSAMYSSKEIWRRARTAPACLRLEIWYCSISSGTVATPTGRAPPRSERRRAAATASPGDGRGGGRGGRGPGRVPGRPLGSGW